MKSYTYQIGEGLDDGLTKVAYSEAVMADGLQDAVDKAKAITRLRPAHANETMVCVLAPGGTTPSWTRTVEEIQEG